MYMLRFVCEIAKFAYNTKLFVFYVNYVSGKLFCLRFSKFDAVTV